MLIFIDSCGIAVIATKEYPIRKKKKMNKKNINCLIRIRIPFKYVIIFSMIDINKQEKPIIRLKKLILEREQNGGIIKEIYRKKNRTEKNAHT